MVGLITEQLTNDMYLIENAHWLGISSTADHEILVIFSTEATTVRRKIPLFLKILKFHRNEDLKERNNFHTYHGQVQKWTEDGQFFPQNWRVPKASWHWFVSYGGATGSRLVGICSWEDGLWSPSGGISRRFADWPNIWKEWPNTVLTRCNI